MSDVSIDVSITRRLHEEIHEVDLGDLFDAKTERTLRQNVIGITQFLLGDQNAGKTSWLLSLCPEEGQVTLLQSLIPACEITFQNLRICNVPAMEAAGQNPLSLACDQGSLLDTDVAKLTLLFTFRDALFFAEETGNTALTNLLLSRGVGGNDGDCDGSTLLRLTFIELGGDHLDRLDRLFSKRAGVGSEFFFEREAEERETCDKTLKLIKESENAKAIIFMLNAENFNQEKFTSRVRLLLHLRPDLTSLTFLVNRCSSPLSEQIGTQEDEEQQDDKKQQDEDLQRTEEVLWEVFRDACIDGGQAPVAGPTYFSQPTTKPANEAMRTHEVQRKRLRLQRLWTAKIADCLKRMELDTTISMSVLVPGLEGSVGGGEEGASGNSSRGSRFRVTNWTSYRAFALSLLAVKGLDKSAPSFDLVSIFLRISDKLRALPENVTNGNRTPPLIDAGDVSDACEALSIAPTLTVELLHRLEDIWDRLQQLGAGHALEVEAEAQALPAAPRLITGSTQMPTSTSASTSTHGDMGCGGKGVGGEGNKGKGSASESEERRGRANRIRAFSWPEGKEAYEEAKSRVYAAYGEQCTTYT